MSLKENPELIIERLVSYPIVWQPWSDPTSTPIDFITPPFWDGSSSIDWSPANGEDIYQPIPKVDFILPNVRGVDVGFIGYNFPVPLNIPIARPGRSVIELTINFKKSNDRANYTESVLTYTLVNGGDGYSRGEIVFINPSNGNSDAFFIVTDVDVMGTIFALELVNPGHGFVAGNNYVIQRIGGPLGIAADIDVDTIGEYPALKDHDWALIQGEEIWPLRREYEDDDGVYFRPKTIVIEKYVNQFNPAIAWLRGQNTDSTGTGGFTAKEYPWSYMWYLIATRFVELVIAYKITYQDAIDNGDIQDIPINMGSITRMLANRDRRRDQKRGRPVTPIKDRRRNAADLRRRREAQRPIGNAPY